MQNYELSLKSNTKTLPTKFFNICKKYTTQTIWNAWKFTTLEKWMNPCTTGNLWTFLYIFPTSDYISPIIFLHNLFISTLLLINRRKLLWNLNWLSKHQVSQNRITVLSFISWLLMKNLTNRKGKTWK